MEDISIAISWLGFFAAVFLKIVMMYLLAYPHEL